MVVPGLDTCIDKDVPLGVDAICFVKTLYPVTPRPAIATFVVVSELKEPSPVEL